MFLGREAVMVFNGGGGGGEKNYTVSGRRGEGDTGVTWHMADSFCSRRRVKWLLGR